MLVHVRNEYKTELDKVEVSILKQLISKSMESYSSKQNDLRSGHHNTTIAYKKK